MRLPEIVANRRRKVKQTGLSPTARPCEHGNPLLYFWPHHYIAGRRTRESVGALKIGSRPPKVQVSQATGPRRDSLRQMDRVQTALWRVPGWPQAPGRRRGWNSQAQGQGGNRTAVPGVHPFLFGKSSSRSGGSPPCLL